MLILRTHRNIMKNLRHPVESIGVLDVIANPRNIVRPDRPLMVAGRRSGPATKDKLHLMANERLLQGFQGELLLVHVLISLQNVKEHATLSAGASVDHGVDVETTKEHVNRAADRGCCVSSCSPSLIFHSGGKSSPHTRHV